MRFVPVTGFTCFNAGFTQQVLGTTECINSCKRLQIAVANCYGYRNNPMSTAKIYMRGFESFVLVSRTSLAYYIIMEVSVVSFFVLSIELVRPRRRTVDMEDGQLPSLSCTKSGYRCRLNFTPGWPRGINQRHHENCGDA